MKQPITYVWLLCLWFSFGCLPQQGYGQGRDSILVDFGTVPSPAPWNNLDDFANGRIASLSNTRSLQTAYGLTVSDAFTGVNTAGTQAADPTLGFPATATGDSFFGNTGSFNGSVEPTGAVTLTGLRTDKEYTLIIFASRSNTSDTREAAYTAEGQPPRRFRSMLPTTPTVRYA